MSAPNLTPDKIAAELDRIITSSQFASSPRVTELLQHIVDAHLKGTAGHLTGITIAQDLFGKDESFDPSKNPIVRVNVARLRRMLDKYYQGHGQNNPLRFSIPKGSYAPLIEPHFNTVPETSKKPLWAYALGACAVAITALFSANIININKENPVVAQIEEIKRYPTVVVLPFENLTGDSNFDTLKTGFQRQIVADLYPFRVVRVLHSEETLSDLALSENRKADYVITGSINSLEPEIDLSIDLIELPEGNTILTQHVRRDSQSLQYFETLIDISSELSRGFAGPEGTLVKKQIDEIKARIDSTTHTVKNLSAFECFSRFREYLSSKNIPKLQSAYACLQRELELHPNDSTLTSALAVLTFDIGYFNENEEIRAYRPEMANANFDPKLTTQDALDLAYKAVTLDPSNDIARGYLADAQMAFGDIDGAYISLQQAIASNRGNPNHLANLALVNSYLGKWDDAIKLSKEAMARNPDCDWYYSMPIFYKAIIERDAKTAQHYLPKVTKGLGNYMTSMFSLFAASVSNDKEALENLRPVVQGYVDSHKEDPLKHIRISGGSEEIFDAFKREMRLSGIIF